VPLTVPDAAVRAAVTVAARFGLDAQEPVLPADPAGPLRPDEQTIGSMLRDLHAALRRYPRTPQVLAPLQDIPAFLARPQTQVNKERPTRSSWWRRLRSSCSP
jgi:hypothetical protein